jgi:two-component system alkaline phosphatase synthesis response regulator PhoP
MPTERTRKVLVVEDEKDIRELVRYNLEQEGFQVLEAEEGELALTLMRRERPALVVLDIMLPGMSGLDICRAIRRDEENQRLPVLMLTAKAAEVDKIVGLEVGADDYVTKPFSTRELVARVKAVLRRAHGPDTERPHEIYERGRLRIDFDTYEVFLDGAKVALSLREFELLGFFVRHPNRVFDRARILDMVWGHDTYVEPRTVDVHVRRLRMQIERNDTHPELILTVRGVGYKFNDAALDA